MYSFITAKGYDSETAKGRDSKGDVRESSKCETSGCPLPVETWMVLALSAVICDHTQSIANQGSSLKPLLIEVFIGVLIIYTAHMTGI